MGHVKTESEIVKSALEIRRNVNLGLIMTGRPSPRYAIAMLIITLSNQLHGLRRESRFIFYYSLEIYKRHFQ